MKSTISIPLLALLLFPAGLVAQEVPKPNADAPTPKAKPARAEPAGSQSASTDPPPTKQCHANSFAFGVGKKFHYYFTETYFNGSGLTAPAVRAGIRMANPPGKRGTAYPTVLPWA